MTEKRFTRYLFDGGFTFGDEYIPPKWSISDKENKDSKISYLEFEDEYKDLCDEIIDELNYLMKESGQLKQKIEELEKENMRLEEKSQAFENFIRVNFSDMMAEKMKKECKIVKRDYTSMELYDSKTEKENKEIKE